MKEVASRKERLNTATHRRNTIKCPVDCKLEFLPTMTGSIAMFKNYTFSQRGKNWFTCSSRSSSSCNGRIKQMGHLMLSGKLSHINTFTVHMRAHVPAKCHFLFINLRIVDGQEQSAQFLDGYSR
ncbi:jg8393 [Pararge aegeria aegeria]|uniref:Jg8393 protein n=1 Tax=Pararge aegeria aegeria TaxID=348720 RepID=A0A8S4SL85_9NEOP|nr:jg8393 [Pararge aegeria aegeria]